MPAKWKKRSKPCARRRDELDAHRTAIEQLRGEVSATQRETLELRLATEEIWARLCGTMAPAALTQSLGQLRLKLSDQNRLALAEIQEKRAEMQLFAATLSEQHDKLVAQRQQLQQWLTRRTAEIEQQAAVLVAREQQLDRQESDTQRLLAEHQEERRGHQQEIRRLLRQLRHSEPAAA